MNCPGCHAENDSTNRFCARCGAALTSDAAGPRYRDPAWLARREIALLVGGLVAIFGAVFAAWYVLFARQGPAAVVTAFVEADLAGRPRDQHLLVSGRWDSRLVLSIFQEYRKQAGGSPFAGYRVLRTSVSGSRAYVDVEINPPAPVTSAAGPPSGPPSGPAASGQPVTVTFALVRESEGWRIEPAETAASVAGELAMRGYRQISNLGGALGSMPGLPTPPGPLLPSPPSGAPLRTRP